MEPYRPALPSGQPGAPPRLARLRLPAAVALAALGGAAHAEPGVSAAEILLGCTLDLSGPLANEGRSIVRATEATVRDINAHGGVHGRRLRFEFLDDGYDPQRSADNARRFLQMPVFALCSCIGTANNLAILPLLRKELVPLYGPNMAVRPKGLRNVFHFRASFGDEAVKLVGHADAVGVRRIALAYQDNPFGRAVLERAAAELERRRIAPAALVPLAPGGEDLPKALAALLAAAPTTVVVLAAGAPLFGLVKALRPRQRGIQVSTLSVLPARALAALGDDAIGLTLSQVVPHPWSSPLPIVRDFRAMARQAGIADYGYSDLESYASLHLLAEGLRRAGRSPTRQRFIAALENMNDYDLGGIPIDFSGDPRTASRFVELTYVDRNGKLIR